MDPIRTAVEGVVVSVSVNPWNRLRPLLNNTLCRSLDIIQIVNELQDSFWHNVQMWIMALKQSYLFLWFTVSALQCTDNIILLSLNSPSKQQRSHVIRNPAMFMTALEMLYTVFLIFFTITASAASVILCGS